MPADRATVKILCTADWHVGRRPSRVPAGDAAAASCAAMAGAIADYAVAEGVDLVAIAGDVVDGESRYHEALGPVERAVRRMTGAGIDVVAVAGNHDFDTLPRLADALAPAGDDGGDATGRGRFRLLGRGGAWEAATVCGGRLRVVGWSFPAASVAASPLDTLDPAALGPSASSAPSAPPTPLPTLGLLHADLDAPASRYAPASSADLRSLGRAAGVGLWLLGHVHAPRRLDPPAPGDPAILYPGSPQAMDPGEPGRHGPWLVALDPAGAVADCRHVALSAVRYEPVTIDVAGVADRAEFDGRVDQATRAAAAAVARDGGPGDLGDAVAAPDGGLRHLRFRATLVGRTPAHGSVAAWASALTGAPPRDHAAPGGRPFDHAVEHAEVRTGPAIDLADLAAGDDLPGELARLLLAWGDDAPTPSAPDGVAAVASSLVDRVSTAGRDEVAPAAAYRDLPADRFPPPTPADARDALRRQAAVLLDALLAGRPNAGGSP